MNLIKTDLRNRMGSDIMNDLMLISYLGPKDIKDFDPLPAIELWKSQKKRRFLNT